MFFEFENLEAFQGF